MLFPVVGGHWLGRIGSVIEIMHFYRSFRAFSSRCCLIEPDVGRYYHGRWLKILFKVWSWEFRNKINHDIFSDIHIKFFLSCIEFFIGGRLYNFSYVLFHPSLSLQDATRVRTNDSKMLNINYLFKRGLRLRSPSFNIEILVTLARSGLRRKKMKKKDVQQCRSKTRRDKVERT